ncbi:MAG TPA: hypothetical protein VHF25_06850 [Nitriliruptorales bacterium]|nr:hypothetical protein [Nitriliruptorales bacterium]
MRSFARSQLAVVAELDDVLRRHAAYFAGLSERAEPQLRGREQQEWMNRLDEERDNLRAALSWSFEDGDATFGLRIVAALRDYWFYQGLIREMETWTGRSLARVAGRGPVCRPGSC